MRSLLVVALLAGPALADPKPAAPPPAKAAPAKAAPCKKTVVGRGLDRKVLCVQEASGELTVTATQAKPNVVIVPRDGKAVTGRPKSDDRLKGLSPRL
jgi:hypothetical protein